MGTERTRRGEDGFGKHGVDAVLDLHAIRIGARTSSAFAVVAAVVVDGCVASSSSYGLSMERVPTTAAAEQHVRANPRVPI